jgi:predicted NBD/HSP70 family sugar kinase
VCKRKACLTGVTSLQALSAYVLNQPPDEPQRVIAADELIELAYSYQENEHGEDSPEFRAQHGLEVAARSLGSVLGPVIDGLNPRRVILGGKIGAQVYPLVTRSLNRGIDAEHLVSPSIGAAKTVGGSRELIGETSVRGAIALALESAPEHLALRSMSAGEYEDDPAVVAG